MMDMVIHDDGHTNIECNDALLPYDNFDPRRDIKPSKYHVVLTNPPFGAKEKRKEVLKTFVLGKTSQGKTRKSQRKEILFIERCLDLLRSEGRLGIVLPDGILNNPKDVYVRNYILNNAKVIGVVSLPAFTFVPFGSGMKTSLVFLQKLKKGEKTEWGEYPIFLAIAENIGYDSTGREIKSNDLPDILKSYLENSNFEKAMFVEPKDFVKRLKVDKLKTTFDFTRLDPEYYFLTLVADRLLSRCPYELKTLNEIKDTITSGSRPGGRAEYIEGEIPSLEGGNISGDGRLIMEDIKYIPLDFHVKHKKSAVKPLDILMVKDGATTGKVAIVPPDFPFKECNINEHLFIIRVKEIYNPWYVFGFLLSNLGQVLIRREITGGAQGGITKNSVNKIIIPIPPNSIQSEIEEQVKKTLNEVTKKEQEIKQIVDESKKWVSDLILSHSN
jgi:type I restriction enzyme M protein